MEIFLNRDPEDLEILNLDPSRRERVNIPPGPPPQQEPQARLNNFDMVFLGYDEKQAVIEATRCIHCPYPEPCILACPLHNNIPKALLAIEEGKYEEAANVFRTTSNFPEVCGRLCPQEILCEGSCTVGGYDRAVNIGKLEAFCTDWQRNHSGFPPPPFTPKSGCKVAIVGSGPASIAVAEEMIHRGHSVVVYEDWPKPGGFLVYGIPGFKLAKDLVMAKIAYLESIGVKFICNTRVGRDVQVDDLRQQFDAVFLGVGAPMGHKIKIPGEELIGVYQATEYLVRGNLAQQDLPEWVKGLPEISQTVAVIGGGDTSADCVRTARRLQVQHGFADGMVVDYYRGTEAEMRVREEEYHHAMEEGVNYEFLAAPVRFIGDGQGHVCQIELVRMRTKPSNQPEQRIPSRIRIPIPDSNFIVPADTVVLAIGYGGDEFIPTRTPALRTTKPGLFEVDAEATGRTTLGGVYAAGDDVHGVDLIVTAIAAARKVARAMDSYLSNPNPKFVDSSSS